MSSTKNKTAVITGITGQDGSYLAEFLLEKGYVVYGMIRKSSVLQGSHIDHLILNPKYSNKLFFITGDLSDKDSINKIICDVKPDEFYNLGAQTHVNVSLENPQYTADVTGKGILRILEAIEQFSPKTRFFQASSSETFGDVTFSPQNEHTPFHARNPYSEAKIFAHNVTVDYRKNHNIFSCCGILYNHESERRGNNFVTMKIALSVARIVKGHDEVLSLGNIDACRDWGYAPEYVEAMWLMLQQDVPDDYVIASGKTHTVREFVEVAFAAVNISIEWIGNGLDEIGIDSNTKKVLVKIDPKFFRQTEPTLLTGDITKIKHELHWVPKTKFDDIVSVMVTHAMNR